MNTSYRFSKFVGILVIIGLVIGMPLAGYALQKPTPEMIEQYKQDGTLAQRIEDAKMIGNHRLASKFINKLHPDRMPIEEVEQPTVMTPPPAWRGMPTTGTVKVLVLLIDFADTPHIASDTNAVITTAINGTPSTGFPYESLHNFYDRSSYGQLNIQGNVLGWYTTAYNRSAIVQTTTGRENLIKEALNFFNTAGHDFTQYDNDGDGYIDYFAVIWSGSHGAWASFWWGYQTGFSDSSYMLDGKRLGSYSWQWESYSYPSGSFSPSVLIHETGHALGLPDLYDYDVTVGPDNGVGGLDQMDANWGDHNCFSKYILDWLTPTFLTTGSTNVTLNPSSSSQNCIIAMPGIAAGPFQEYFIVQNRNQSGNDTGYPNSGLVIWHVDARLDGSGADYLYDNSYTAHKLVRLMEADGLEEIENNIDVNAGDYYVPGKLFTPTSTPNSKRYDGTSTNLNLTNITANGSQRSANISFGAEGIVDCSGGAVVLQNVTFTSGNTYNCIATTSITAGVGVTVQSGATVNFRAPIIDLRPGFHVQNGAVFSAMQGDPAPSCPVIPNGSFESGRTAWTEYSTHGWTLINSSGFPTGVSPHGGSWATWLGGDDDETSYIQQQVTVSSACPYLVFYHWIGSQDGCGNDHGTTRINGTVVETVNHCSSNNTGGWVAKSINLSSYADQTVTLQIRSESNSSLNSNWFIDDVSFRASAAVADLTTIRDAKAYVSTVLKKDVTR